MSLLGSGDGREEPDQHQGRRIETAAFHALALPAARRVATRTRRAALARLALGVTTRSGLTTDATRATDTPVTDFD